MKFLQLSAVCAAILASTAVSAATPYEYNADNGIIRNTTGAVVGTTKTLIDTALHPGSISAEIGTLGYGAGISWSVNESTELVAGWNGADYDDDIDLDHDDWINWNKAFGDGLQDFRGQLDYDADLSNPYLGVQMRPFSNAFTLGAGVLVPDNNVKGVITTDRTSVIEPKDREYTLNRGDQVVFEVENDNTLAPYATIGFRPNINDKWGIFGEVGAAYMSDMKAKAAVVRNGVTTGSSTTNVGADADLANDLASELKNNDDLWYPIAKIGATYRF